MLNNAGPSDAAELVAVVAANIRRLRERRGVSLGELALSAGIGKSTLSMLESGKANPSVETLWAVAAALNIPLGDLIQPHEPDVRVIRAGDGVPIHAEDARLTGRLLVASGRRGVFEVYELTAEPGKLHEARAHTQGAVEHVFVACGRLRCGPTGSTIELGPGDLAVFAADAAHEYEALEPGTRAVLVMGYG